MRALKKFTGTVWAEVSVLSTPLAWAWDKAVWSRVQKREVRKWRR